MPFSTERLQVTERSLLDAAYQKARKALQSETGLTNSDLDALTAVMTDALLSLYRAGQVDATKLSTFAIATTLRHICGRR